MGRPFLDAVGRVAVALLVIGVLVLTAGILLADAQARLAGAVLLALVAIGTPMARWGLRGALLTLGLGGALGGAVAWGYASTDPAATLGLAAGVGGTSSALALAQLATGAGVLLVALFVAVALGHERGSARRGS